MAESLTGIGVCPGFAAGPVYRVAPPPGLPDPVPVTDPRAEVGRAVRALSLVAADLTSRADASARRGDGSAVVEILRAQALMAADPALADAVTDAVGEGSDAPHAIDAALAVHRAAFVEAGGYLAERVADLDDIRDRAVAACLGVAMPGIPSPGHPFILIAADLAPAETARLDPAQVLALVTEAGGPTSHTAILARTLGLPAVVRCVGLLGTPDGTAVTVDGTTGQVVVGVDESAMATARAAEEVRQERLGRGSGPGRTSDGHSVPLLVNIGSAGDLPPGGEGEGVGLFRTELLYLGRTEPPSLAEQIEAYAAVFRAQAGRKVVVRTLDAGADKPLPFLALEEGPNPALGVRGLRTARLRPDVLRIQLEAIATAARGTRAEVWVMAPMVSTPGEAATFAAECRAAGITMIGAMVEVPAAAARADALLREVDFLSIGTNDLSQYAFAADRMCGDLADLLDPWQPALLALIAVCAEAGRVAGRPVGVCGEAAAHPGLAVVLAGLGVTSLSMPARAIPAVRAALAAHTIAECRSLATAALASADAVVARAVVDPGRWEG